MSLKGVRIWLGITHGMIKSWYGNRIVAAERVTFVASITNIIVVGIIVVAPDDGNSITSSSTTTSTITITVSNTMQIPNQCGCIKRIGCSPPINSRGSIGELFQNGQRIMIPILGSQEQLQQRKLCTHNNIRIPRDDSTRVGKYKARQRGKTNGVGTIFSTNGVDILNNKRCQNQLLPVHNSQPTYMGYNHTTNIILSL